MAKKETTEAPEAAPHVSTITATVNAKAKGTGTTITLNLAGHPSLLAKLRAAAKDDDRELTNYLRRRLVELDRQGVLIPGADQAPLFDGKE